MCASIVRGVTTLGASRGLSINSFLMTVRNDDKKLWCIGVEEDLFGLRHTLLPRMFYCLRTLCIVNLCSNEQFPSNCLVEQFASNCLVTVCFLIHFTPDEQHNFSDLKMECMKEVVSKLHNPSHRINE